MAALRCLEYKRRNNLEYLTPCIHRIPDEIREQNKSAYNPSMVSIGPFHRGAQHLQAMEAVKLSYMNLLLERAPPEQRQALQQGLVSAVSNWEHLARNCYADQDINCYADQDINQQLDDKIKIKETMLVDGCFIVELLIRFHKKFPDPMLANRFRYVAVKHDLLLLENQIPFFVLQELFKLTMEYIPERDRLYPSLTKCLFLFFQDMMGLEKFQTGTENTKEVEVEVEDASTTVCHILHLLHKSYVQPSQVKTKATPTPKTKYGTPACDCMPEIRNCTLQMSHKYDNTNTSKKETWEDFQYSATQLHMAGVKLVASGNGKDLFAVKFSTDHRSWFWLCRRARFEIPPFCIYDYTESFLANMIAFEQTCPGIEHYFTSHAMLMDELINSTEDVKLLEEAGIIRNQLGSTEEVCGFFNHICKNVAVVDFQFEKQCIDVTKYCEKRWPKFLVKLRQDYFSSPWTVISVIAAFILFALTLVQTIYTLLSYY